jgi:hypothetical protein
MIVGLQVENARDIEVHVMEVQAEIVAPDIVEELRERYRIGAVLVVLAIDQFLPVCRFDALIAKFQARKLDAHCGQEDRTEHRPGDTAAQTSACGISPTTGSTFTCSENLKRTGRKAISVMTRAHQADAQPLHSCWRNRIVSSCTRCDAPSTCRSLGQCAT